MANNCALSRRVGEACQLWEITNATLNSTVTRYMIFFSHPASARISDRRETYNNFLTGLVSVFGLASFFWK